MEKDPCSALLKKSKCLWFFSLTVGRLFSFLLVSSLAIISSETSDGDVPQFVSDSQAGSHREKNGQPTKIELVRKWKH